MKNFLEYQINCRYAEQDEVNQKLKEFLFFYKKLLQNNQINFDSISTYFLFQNPLFKTYICRQIRSYFHKPYTLEVPLNAQKHIEILEGLLRSKSDINTLNDIRNKARIEILEKYRENKDNKRIFIIEAPTRSIETLAALRLALEIAKNENKHTIITALPFTSIIDKRTPNIKKYLKTTFC